MTLALGIYKRFLESRRHQGKEFGEHWGNAENIGAGTGKTREGQEKWRCLGQSVTSIHIGLSVFHVDSEQLEAWSDVVPTFVSAVSRCLTEQVVNQI